MNEFQCYTDQLQKEAGLSRERIAQMVKHITGETKGDKWSVARDLNGKNKHISPERFRAYAQVLKAPYEELITRWIAFRYSIEFDQVSTRLAEQIRAQELHLAQVQRATEDVVRMAGKLASVVGGQKSISTKDEHLVDRFLLHLAGATREYVLAALDGADDMLKRQERLTHSNAGKSVVSRGDSVKWGS